MRRGWQRGKVGADPLDLMRRRHMRDFASCDKIKPIDCIIDDEEEVKLNSIAPSFDENIHLFRAYLFKYIVEL